ncbi:MAG: GxxExxY protein [Bacteroidia bacterium]|nr:GxxExxY protein [Bacteroidia bacterium]
MFQDLTNGIIKAYYRVYNSLGYGFLEKVYQNAMTIELKNNGLSIKCQQKIIVFYQQTMVGEYFADIVVENSVILSPLRKLTMLKISFTPTLKGA